MSQLPYDPNLRAAMEEITEILRKRDCLGQVCLVSPSHSEFKYHVEATWSLLRWETVDEEKRGIRIRSKKEDFPSREAQAVATTSSIHALTSFLEHSRKSQTYMESFIAMIRKQVTVLWSVWGEPDSHPGDGR